MARQLSPRRGTTTAHSIPGLVEEQLRHFSVDPKSEIGQVLSDLCHHIYAANVDMHRLWEMTIQELGKMDRRDRVALFNAKKFLCFQLAKLLDTLQNPFRQTYQSITDQQSSRIARGPYALFDNVTALFSATPVITRTATYLYACTEWIDDAFQGREPLLEVYSRLLNPTSISLANHIVDLECGPLANEYMAWNFNSGMAAIDGVMSHLVGYQDLILSSRNIYGGAFQLLHDWFRKPSNLDVAVRFFDGYTAEAFMTAFVQLRSDYMARIRAGRQVYVYIESPCNPHGYVLDIPRICKIAHAEGLTVILDSTVATPFLSQPFQRKDPAERPDFVIHSYTKDITGTGTTTAGVVIARNERMFIPKGGSATTTDLSGRAVTYQWNETLFWNVFYVKGAFLDAEKAFEVISGSRTLDLRMTVKAINTTVLAKFLDSHPLIDVKCNALEKDENAGLRNEVLRLGMPAPLFTIHFEHAWLKRDAFTRFFDCLEPAFGHQVSLGQSSTVILCPALTSHSEMNAEELKEAGISPTTIRIAVGDEDPRQLLAHFVRVCQLVLDPVLPGFSEKFMEPDALDTLYRETYHSVHDRLIASQPKMKEWLK